MASLGNINFNTLKRYMNPQGVKDIDKFLDAMPTNVGYNSLIATGIVWLIAGSAIFFASMEAEKVTSLRAELMEIESLKPPIPIVRYTPVSRDALDGIKEKIEKTFKGVTFSGTGDRLTVSATDLDYFPQFVAAINYLQHGGSNWRVTIDSMCVGRDCSGSKLSAKLAVETVRVDTAPKEEEESESE